MLARFTTAILGLLLLNFSPSSALADANVAPFMGIWLQKGKPLTNHEINGAEITFSGSFYFIDETGARSAEVGTLNVLSDTQAELVWKKSFLRDSGAPLERAKLTLELKNRNLEITCATKEKIIQSFVLQTSSKKEINDLSLNLRDQNQTDLMLNRFLIGQEYFLIGQQSVTTDMNTGKSTSEYTKVEQLVDQAMDGMYTPKSIKFVNSQNLILNQKIQTNYRIVNGMLTVDLYGKPAEQSALENMGRISSSFLSFYREINVISNRDYYKRNLSGGADIHISEVTTYYYRIKSKILESLLFFSFY